MGNKKRWKKKRLGRSEPVCVPARTSTPLERVVVEFLGTVREVHREEMEVTRAMGRWMGQVTEKLLDAGLEVAREERERRAEVS